MIPLNAAVLCCECEAITRGRNNQCEVCGSGALLNQAVVLNRDAGPVSQPKEVTVRMGAA